MSESLSSLPAHAQKTIEEMQQKIADQEQEILKRKKGINVILDSYGKKPLYLDLDVVGAGVGPIQPGQFYGQPLATAVREILTRRRAAGQGAATTSEIHTALSEGGYRFDTDDETNAKRGLRGSLAKNTATFHKLPTGHWGLTEWYPNINKGRPLAPKQDLGGPLAPKQDVKEETKNGEKDDFDFEKKESELSGAVPA